jgi:hypothetical protein
MKNTLLLLLINGFWLVTFAQEAQHYKVRQI